MKGIRDGLAVEVVVDQGWTTIGRTLSIIEGYFYEKHTLSSTNMVFISKPGNKIAL